MNNARELAAGHEAVHKDVYSTAVLGRVAAMLDLDVAAFEQQHAVPRGWQFPLLAAQTRRSALRGDGFAGLGVPMPDLGLPRVMLGGRTVQFFGDISVGEPVFRRSSIQSVERKTTRNGEMAVVKVAHSIAHGEAAVPALVETQTYVLLPARQGLGNPEPPPPASVPHARHAKTITPDDSLLFQYSALGFNAHRIHLDRGYAQQVEGFPDLVVNGGLATLLMTEFLTRDIGLTLSAISVRHVAPLYCNRSLTMTADEAGGGWRARIFDDANRLAVEMEAGLQ